MADGHALIQSLEAIVEAQNDHAQKVAQLNPILLDPYNGDFGVFLLSLSTLPDDELCKVMKLVQFFEPAPLSLCRSSEISKVVAIFVNRHNPELSLQFLHYVELGVFGACTFKVPRESMDILVDFAISCIPDESLALSEKACEITYASVTVLHLSELIEILFSYSQRHIDDSVLYLRFMALLSRISAASEDLFRSCETMGAVAAIVRLCTTDDILVQINALELLVDLASTARGLEYMCSHRVINWLITASCGGWGEGENQIETTGATAADPLISAQALRILGSVFTKASKRSFDLLTRLDTSCVRHFLNTINGYLVEGSEEQKVTGLVVLADFAVISLSTLQLVIDSTGTGTSSASTNSSLLISWMDLLQSSKPELIAAVLHSVAKVLNQQDTLFLPSAPGINSSPSDAGAGDAAIADGGASGGGGGGGGGGGDPLTVFTSVPESKRDAGQEEGSGGDGSGGADGGGGVTEVVELKRRLVAAVGTAKRMSTMTFLLRLATQPIESSRYAAVDLLTALAAQRTGWGLQLLFRHVDYSTSSSSGGGGNLYDDFYRYLRERYTEHSKDGKDWKFGLILAISKCPARVHLPSEVNESIDRLVKQGPYFLPARVEVQTMEH